jgi:hypothetical protein
LRHADDQLALGRLIFTGGAAFGFGDILRDPAAGGDIAAPGISQLDPAVTAQELTKSGRP